MDRKLSKAKVEALLFAADGALAPKEIAEIIEVEPEEVIERIAEIKEEYERRGAGLTIRSVGGGYMLTTDPELAEYVGRLFADRGPTRLTRASLETLAIIAYRQPVTRNEIEEIRGVKTTGALNTLIERGLIAEKGRKNTIGRPILYGTTRKFLEQFGLQNLEDLPEIEYSDGEGEG